MQSELNARARTATIGLAVDVNETNWLRFMELPRDARQRFLSNLLDDGIVELLYKNPELLAEVLNPRVGP